MSECAGTSYLPGELSKEKMEVLTKQIREAKEASLGMALLNENDKNSALESIEKALKNSIDYIVEANLKDLNNPDNAELNSAMRDRLMLNPDRIHSMAAGIRKVINMKDPVATVIEGWQHPNGMSITKIRVPLGLIGIIYEARPNVTTDAIALAIKSGNGVVLKGSRQATNTNLAIMQVVTKALDASKVPIAAIQYLSDKTREGCKALLEAEGLIDLVIPRGGESLNKFVTENSLIPVLGAGGGVCHLYIDKSADIDKAVNIAVNAKVSRPSVCNSCETILIDRAIFDKVASPLVEALSKNGVEIFADASLKQKFPKLSSASEADWHQEYLDLKISIRVVDDINQAIEHINFYSTGHSETIVSKDLANVELFKRRVNSACVYINASTRFTDGEEFGFGAEMGISTQKLHARGPIGARELCTYKYIIEGDGNVR